MTGEPSREEKRFQGAAVSGGIARGVVYLHLPIEEDLQEREILETEIPSEISRLEDALLETRRQILEMQLRISEAIGSRDAGIFDAHLLVVEDRTLIEEVVRTLHSEKKNIETVFGKVAARYSKTLSEIDDPYLRERALDIHDVTRRVLRNLTGETVKNLAEMTEPHILLAKNLTPSDTAQLNRQAVLGFVTEVGSRTSHTAIMARSLNIPAVVGLHDLEAHFNNQDHVLLDGYNGLLILNPSDQTLWEYGELEIKKTVVAEKLGQLRETESTTIDGSHIILSANIELPEDLDLVGRVGAEGIGLYRTEFFYLNKTEPPGEEEQYENYLRVARATRPHSAIIRTLDLGGDKFVGSLQLPDELNPFLGWRAIRFCLERVDIFKTQLRAILRASAEGNVRIMYPMISGLDELRAANRVLEECKKELRAEGKAFNEEIEVGAMIEVPSAAVTADILAKEVKFFSIGTNDLIQYSIAVDRVNERIAHLYEPTHPAIIRLIKQVADAAHAQGIWVGVCGEMAGEIIFTPLLIGLGIDELSAGASLVPRVKKAVLSVNIQTCRELADRAMQLSTGAEILAECETVARNCYPELLV